MMNRREVICKKIEAVKNWLVSAEQNFINDNSLRGELDLMLAEAEMSDIKKTSPMRKKIFFSINILIIISVFFTISFIYFVKDDIIFPEDKKIDTVMEETRIPEVVALPEMQLSGEENPKITTELKPLVEIEANKELFVPEIQQEISFKSDVIIKPQEKVVPILTAEETREMVKLARENLRK